MKKIKYILGAALGLLLFSACENYAEFETEVPYNPVQRPLRAAWAEDGDGLMLEGLVDQEAKQVTFSLYTLPDLTMVKVTLDIPKRCKLISPAEPETVLDLSSGCQIIVDAEGEQIAYDVSAKLAEFRDFDIKTCQPLRFENDCYEPWNNNEGWNTPIKYWTIFDGKHMSGPEKYNEVEWLNYQFRSPQMDCEDKRNQWATFSFDTVEPLYMHTFAVHPYWFGVNWQITKYELWGYCKEGKPDESGDWSEWTKLGSYSFDANTFSWDVGYLITFDKETIKKARYYRVRCTENIQRRNNTTASWDTYNLCEVELDRYNKR